MGSEVVLTGELIDYEGVNYSLQWYFRKNGQGDYIMIDGETGLTFTYRVTEATYSNSYHLGVIVMDFAMSGD